LALTAVLFDCGLFGLPPEHAAPRTISDAAARISNPLFPSVPSSPLRIIRRF
jgi:hypothetical protein